MPAVVTLPFVCESTPEVRRRVSEAVQRVMSPMAKERVWKLEVSAGVKTGDGPFSLKGFEQVDSETMKATKVLAGLEQEDLRRILSEVHEHFHGDEHG